MTINDGFGDLLGVDEAIQQYEGSLRRITGKYQRLDQPGYQDLLQEVRIAFWRQYDVDPGDGGVALALHAAKRRASNLFNPERREHQTGYTGSTGSIPVTTTAILDAPVGDGHTSLLEVVFPGVDALAGVEMAYHHGEISRAVNALEPEHREYVVRRFWEGWTDSEIARHTGVSTSGINNRWSRRIRPTLVEHLGHLVSA